MCPRREKFFLSTHHHHHGHNDARFPTRPPKTALHLARRRLSLHYHRFSPLGILLSYSSSSYLRHSSIIVIRYHRLSVLFLCSLSPEWFYSPNLNPKFGGKAPRRARRRERNAKKRKKLKKKFSRHSCPNGPNRRFSRCRETHNTIERYRLTSTPWMTMIWRISTILLNTTIAIAKWRSIQDLVVSKEGRDITFF